LKSRGKFKIQACRGFDGLLFEAVSSGIQIDVHIGQDGFQLAQTASAG